MNGGDGHYLSLARDALRDDADDLARLVRRDGASPLRRYARARHDAEQPARRSAPDLGQTPLPLVYAEEYEAVACLLSLRDGRGRVEVHALADGRVFGVAVVARRAGENR